MTDPVIFGDELVSPEEKTRRVGHVFSSVARRYDLMNDLMSGGLHRAWKDALVSSVNPPKGGRPYTWWRPQPRAGGTAMIIAFGADHAGFELKQHLLRIARPLVEEGREVLFWDDIARKHPELLHLLPERDSVRMVPSQRDLSMKR